MRRKGKAKHFSLVAVSCGKGDLERGVGRGSYEEGNGKREGERGKRKEGSDEWGEVGRRRNYILSLCFYLTKVTINALNDQ